MYLSCSVPAEALAPTQQKKREEEETAAEHLSAASGQRWQNCLVFPSNNQQTLVGGEKVTLIPNKNEV